LRAGRQYIAQAQQGASALLTGSGGHGYVPLQMLCR
jgi:hypothetical protein